MGCTSWRRPVAHLTSLCPLKKASGDGEHASQAVCVTSEQRQQIVIHHQPPQCEEIRSQGGFLPAWDPRAVITPWVAPLLRACWLAICFPSLSASCAASPGARPREMSKGHWARGRPRVWTALSPNYHSRWIESEKLRRSFINATQSNPGPGAWDRACLSVFPLRP